MAQPIVSSDLGASHTPILSLPISYLSSSQKDDISSKGLVVSVGDNTPIADATPLATYPGQFSSTTALTTNVSLQSHGEIHVDISVFDDPSSRTQADDDEEAQPVAKYITHTQSVQKIVKTFHANIKGEKFVVSANDDTDNVANDVTRNADLELILEPWM